MIEVQKTLEDEYQNIEFRGENPNSRRNTKHERKVSHRSQYQLMKNFNYQELELELMRNFIGRTNSNPGKRSYRGKLFENPFFITNFQRSQHERRRLKAKNRPEKPVQSESTDGFDDIHD